jgi:hypothetical protein
MHEGQKCRVSSPGIKVRDGMDVRSEQIPCMLPQEHEGPHRGNLPPHLRPSPEQEVWEWPNGS